MVRLLRLCSQPLCSMCHSVFNPPERGHPRPAHSCVFQRGTPSLILHLVSSFSSFKSQFTCFLLIVMVSLTYILSCILFFSVPFIPINIPFYVYLSRVLSCSARAGTRYFWLSTISPLLSSAN